MNPTGNSSTGKNRFTLTAGRIIVCGIILSALGAFLAGCSCSTGDTQTSKTLYQRNHDNNLMALNDYNYGNLGESDGLKFYLKNGTVASRVGIDVSDYQGDIDWAALKESGVDFVFLRVGYRGYTEGGIYADDNFADDFLQAQEAGLGVGVYFFSQAKTADEARAEAAFTLNALGGAHLDYPVVYDLEPNLSSGSRTASLDYQQATENTLAFCQAVEAGGYTPMVYLNRAHALSLFDLSQLQGYSFWYAEYADRPSLDFKFAIWQYTNNGHVAGIDAAVDMDLYFTDTAL